MISIDTINSSNNTSSEVIAISNIVNKKVESLFKEEAIDSIKGNETIPICTDTGDLKTITLDKISSENTGTPNIHYSDKQIEYILDQTIDVLRIPIIDEEYNIYIELPEWLHSYLTTNYSFSMFADADPFSYLPMLWMQIIDQPLTKKSKLTLYINNSFYRSYIPIVSGNLGDNEMLIYIPEDSFNILLSVMLNQNSGYVDLNVLDFFIDKLVIFGASQGDSFRAIMTLLPYKCGLGRNSYPNDSIIIYDGHDQRLLNWIEKLYLDYGETKISDYFQISVECKVDKNRYHNRIPMSYDFTGWPWKVTINATDLDSGILYGRSYVQFTKNESTYTQTFLVDEDVFIKGEDLKEIMNYLNKAE